MKHKQPCTSTLPQAFTDSKKAHTEETTNKKQKQEMRKKRLLPGVVLLPEADCWTKATRHKPTNPKLARTKACAYMFTSSVVEREYFSPL